MPLELITEIPLPPERPLRGHKGTFGRTVLIGGSRGMCGAIALAGAAALRSGTGLVFLAVPDVVADTVAAFEPAYQVRPVPADATGQLSCRDPEPLLEVISSASAAGLGPGLGQSSELDHLVASLFQQTHCPLVVDADALNALARWKGINGQYDRRPVERVLTPHPGELGRLLGCSAQQINQNRESSAMALAERFHSTVVLKGYESIVTDGRRLYVNQTGNSGLATGGSGDVLTGLITGLLAQGMDAFNAAVLGVHVHGRAADLAAGELSQMGLIASDLPRYIARVWQDFEQVEVVDR